MADEYVWLICDEVLNAVVLTDPGPYSIEVVKLLHRRTGLSLWRSKSLISRVPATILEDVPREMAEVVVRELLEAGAHAEVRQQ
ncbi:ribosomal protein L7/L12 [Kitasatospora sp. NPDC087271]|uniref:ribosomal protein L7/L12 n=1 Tax=Kitasatospora sp. NPDC087271 TaxID=3364067 RepID=UPI00380A3B85